MRESDEFEQKTYLQFQRNEMTIYSDTSTKEDDFVSNSIHMTTYGSFECALHEVCLVKFLHLFCFTTILLSHLWCTLL